VAQHDAAAFDPPHRFVDALSAQGPASWPARIIGKWRHTHEFSGESTGTRVYDHVDTPVPAAALRSTFVYRHRQLADDLAAHRDAAEAGAKPLTVAVTGASGVVGSALTAFLSTGGHRVIRLEPERPAPDLLSGVDAVVHLAGASIASRIGTTRRLAEAAARADDGPRTFVSASAIGIYGSDRGDALLSEDSAHGEGSPADVVAEWEAATAPAVQGGLRVVTVRTGIVQSARGGTLRLRPGSARQWLSWIGLDDLLDVYYRALYDTRWQDRSMPLHPSRYATPTTRRRWPGCVIDRHYCRRWGGKSSPKPISGWCLPSSRSWATGSGARRSTTRWLTNWGTADATRW
jgi:uncharacterized protein YbjT (DUF2867 family)